MRFVSLALERYGHFEDCELFFRSGAPDLHVVYGANEAGKTTSMAAVSDLLFGFPTRSPYNFLYDYSLLRVGAVLEDDGKTLPCRRKKGSSGTLVGADDQPLDEGTLLAMLRGQTRETFGLSFSLDQEGLRAGGRAMVEARNDLGRALFAAGSGLTGVSDELSSLENESDTIWGPRASNKRSFTLAQRELEMQTRAVREQSLKPKTWLDARSAVAAAKNTLDDAQRRRDEVLAEVSRVERIRRIAPSVRLRTDRLAELAKYASTVDITPQREETAERAMAAAEDASRAKAAAEKLAKEATERMDALAADPVILTQAEYIDELVTGSGAVVKARRDISRLETDQASGAAVIKRLREEAGAIATDPPTRIISSKLRELSLAHVHDASALSQIDESEEDLAHRRKAIPSDGDIGKPPTALAAIIAAVDAARGLGADADARCESSRRKAELAAISLEQALARLAPWTGDAPTLLSLPILTQQEIDETHTTLSNLTSEANRETSMATRAREDAAALVLQMEHLSSGAAVSAEEIAAGRSERDKRWRPLKEYVLSNVPLKSADEAVTAFEATITDADERSDLRFAAADESSRLTDMGQRSAKLILEAEQAEGRATSATERLEIARTAWAETLTSAGYPDMEPSRFLGWLTDRATAEAAHRDAILAADESEKNLGRRAEVRAALVDCLPAGSASPEGVELAPILASAERLRSDGEETEQQQRLDEAAAAQIVEDSEGLARRRKRLEDAAADRADAWRDLLKEAGLDLNISGAIATLDILEDLRVAITAQSDLKARIDGMARDADEHDREVTATADALGIAATKEVSERLDLMRARLAGARSTANVLNTLQDTAASRTAEVAEEDAKLVAALGSLKPLLAETESADPTELSSAIERSRAARALRAAVVEAETAIKAAGDGKGIEELIEALVGVDPDSMAARTQTLATELVELNDEVAAAATTHGDAKRAFAILESHGDPAVDAATDAEQARAELAVLSEQYILKRAQAVTLRWAIEQYRERHQDPMLLRASELFSTLTIGRYAALRIDNDGATPRLLGLRDDGRTVIDVGAMSEGTTDQLFLALRLAAVEQSVAAGVRLPFLADDLFVNFDDERSEAGFRVLADLARTTQVLFFTHHPHLASIARAVVGVDVHSECSLA
ncbi:AAA family ATPase [Parasphingorhabdus sp.]|uniref:AAA family ATPase n=1 Tax=Parasphingorhabdus sp. TaxID=2709688 RepID=UPI003A8FFB21